MTVLLLNNTEMITPLAHIAAIGTILLGATFPAQDAEPLADSMTQTTTLVTNLWMIMDPFEHWHKATWVNKKGRKITGKWIWEDLNDKFHIKLDKPERTCDNLDFLVVLGDTPEWGNWRKV